MTALTLEAPQTTKVIGPPGTGKTTYCLRLVNEAIRSNIPPDKIGYFSFTKQAIHTVQQKLKASGMPPIDFVWFRTIHSLAYHLRDLKLPIVKEEEKKQLAQLAGLEGPVASTSATEAEIADNIVTYAELTKTRLVDVWARTTILRPLPFDKLQRYYELYKSFKRDNGRSDFNDVLKEYIESPLIPVFDLLLIDEAQDLSALQWDIIKLISRKAKRVYVVGDPNQAIFQWNGGRADLFASLQTNNTVILDQSYRLPQTVHSFSQRVAKRCAEPFRFSPTKETGKVIFNSEFPINDIVSSKDKDWLILAYNNTELLKFSDELLKHSMPFETWGTRSKKRLDLEEKVKIVQIYIRFIGGEEIHTKEEQSLKRHLKVDNLEALQITKPSWANVISDLTVQDIEYIYTVLEERPYKIYLSTFHYAKGAEADNVVISPQLTREQYLQARQGERDAWLPIYVGVTRAKSNLYLLAPNSQTAINWAEV